MGLLDRILPTPAAPTAPTFSVVADGVTLPATFEVLSVVTDRAVDRIPTATLVFRDGSLSAQTFAASGSKLLQPGVGVVVSLGYRGTNVDVFAGEITGQRLKITPANSQLVVTLRHQAYRMTLLRQHREFFELSDAEAITDLLLEYSLPSSGPSFGVSQPDLVQHGCTDWDFLITRAQVNGWVTIVRDAIVEVGKPELGLPTTQLGYGINLLGFDGELDARKHFSEYEATAPDTATAASVSETEEGDAFGQRHGQSPHHTHYGAPVSDTELSNRISAYADRSRLAKVRGVAEVIGTDAVRVGDTVSLVNLGDAFDGTAYVSGVRHDMSDRGWTTYLQLGLSDESFTQQHDISAPPAGGSMPAVSGLHLGRVVGIEGDPLGEERIRVVLPASAADGDGRWARLATLTAGQGAGTVFRPAIGELVVVGFLDDDPRYPLILGSLHGSRHAAHIPLSDDNEVSGIRTVGGHEIAFDDGEQTLKISGPAGEAIVLDGSAGSITLSDQNGNRIVMDGGGIKIESSGALTLSAGGNLNASAGGNATLEATTQVSVKGGSGAELSTPGITKVKGSIIQLN